MEIEIEIEIGIEIEIEIEIGGTLILICLLSSSCQFFIP